MNFLNDLKNEFIKTTKFNIELYRRTKAGEKNVDVVADLADQGLLPHNLHMVPAVSTRATAATVTVPVEESKDTSRSSVRVILTLMDSDDDDAVESMEESTGFETSGRLSTPPKQYASLNEKLAVFARSANMLTKRGYRVMDDVPEMYYVTKNIIVCPPLDGLESSEVFAFDPEYQALTKCIPFKSRLKMMLPADADLN